MRGQWDAQITVASRASFDLALRHAARTRAARFDIYENSAPPVKLRPGQTLITINSLDEMRRVELPGSNGLVTRQERNRRFKTKHEPGLPIVIYGNVGGWNSICKVTSGLALALHEMGVAVAVRDFPNELAPVEDRAEWDRHHHLISRTPDCPHAAIFQYTFRPRHDSRNVAWSGVIDASDNFATLIPEHAQERNRHDCTLTYSTHSKRVLEMRGCKNVHLMPLGVDTNIFRPLQKTEICLDGINLKFTNRQSIFNRETFVFFCFGMLQARKGFPDLIDVYAETFKGRDDVLLWCHGRSEQWGDDFSHHMKPDGPPMLWTDGPVSDETLCRMLNRADCYVSAHRLEGFGLLPLQAMACGTQCIVTDYSGPRDYANYQNSLLIPAVETDVDTKRFPFMPQVTWGEPNRFGISVMMVEAMRANLLREARRCNGLDTAAEWSWRRTAEAVIAAIEADGHQVARRS